MLSKSSISLLIFCLVVLSTIESGALKCPPIIIELFISPFSSVHFCFGFFGLFVLIFIYLFIYLLAASSLSCGMQDLSLWCMGFSLVVSHSLITCDTQAL